jgi:NitT/TauT family transport system ATP-binding protein
MTELRDGRSTQSEPLPSGLSRHGAARRSADGDDAGVPIAVERVSKVYPARDGHVVALRDVTLTVAPGEFVSLVGPSGCGKTTLLMMTAGLVPYSSGQIRVGGAPVERPQTNVGIVFQEPTLLPWRTVLANVMLQAEIRHLPKDVYRGRARELLSAVGLSGFEDKLPDELSGGMRQRVSLVRALIHDPPLLMMDEPFGALDAITRDQMNIDIQRLWLERPHTVLFVTHSVPEAIFLSDRIVVMTPRPGEVDREILVPLPRPRTLEMREAPEFATLAGEIRELFLSRGVLRQ